MFIIYRRARVGEGGAIAGVAGLASADPSDKDEPDNSVGLDPVLLAVNSKSPVAWAPPRVCHGDNSQHIGSEAVDQVVGKTSQHDSA